MKKVRLYEEFVNEAKVTKKDFDKVVKLLSKSKHPFTIMFVPKWDEVEIIVGQDAPDPIIDDINQRLSKAGLYILSYDLYTNVKSTFLFFSKT